VSEAGPRGEMRAPRDPIFRVVDLYRRTTASRAAVALVAANAIPLLGVLLFGWSLWTILVLYWLDNGITGFWTIPRILRAEGQVEPGQSGRIGGASFFVAHYGIFWFVHGIFVFTLPAFFGGPGRPFGEINAASVLLGAVALFIGHGVAYFRDYLGRGENSRTTPSAEMARPYGRVVVLHLTIVLGAFGVAMLGASEVQLVLFVVLKTALDLSLYLRQQGGDRGEALSEATPA